MEVIVNALYVQVHCTHNVFTVTSSACDSMGKQSTKMPLQTNGDLVHTISTLEYKIVIYVV